MNKDVFDVVAEKLLQTPDRRGALAVALRQSLPDVRPEDVSARNRHVVASRGGDILRQFGVLDSPTVGEPPSEVEDALKAYRDEQEDKAEHREDADPDEDQDKDKDKREDKAEREDDESGTRRERKADASEKVLRVLELVAEGKTYEEAYREVDQEFDQPETTAMKRRYEAGIKGSYGWSIGDKANLAGQGPYLSEEAAPDFATGKFIVTDLALAGWGDQTGTVVDLRPHPQSSQIMMALADFGEKKFWAPTYMLDNPTVTARRHAVVKKLGMAGPKTIAGQVLDMIREAESGQVPEDQLWGYIDGALSAPGTDIVTLRGKLGDEKIPMSLYDLYSACYQTHSDRDLAASKTAWEAFRNAAPEGTVEQLEGLYASRKRSQFETGMRIRILKDSHLPLVDGDEDEPTWEVQAGETGEVSGYAGDTAEVWGDSDSGLAFEINLSDEGTVWERTAKRKRSGLGDLSEYGISVSMGGTVTFSRDYTTVYYPNPDSDDTENITIPAGSTATVDSWATDPAQGVYVTANGTPWVFVAEADIGMTIAAGGMAWGRTAQKRAGWKDSNGAPLEIGNWAKSLETGWSGKIMEEADSRGSADGPLLMLQKHWGGESQADDIRYFVPEDLVLIENPDSAYTGKKRSGTNHQYTDKGPIRASQSGDTSMKNHLTRSRMAAKRAEGASEDKDKDNPVETEEQKEARRHFEVARKRAEEKKDDGKGDLDNFGGEKAPPFTKEDGDKDEDKKESKKRLSAVGRLLEAAMDMDEDEDDDEKEARKRAEADSEKDKADVEVEIKTDDDKDKEARRRARQEALNRVRADVGKPGNAQEGPTGGSARDGSPQVADEVGDLTSTDKSKGRPPIAQEGDTPGQSRTEPGHIDSPANREVGVGNTTTLDNPVMGRVDRLRRLNQLMNPQRQAAQQAAPVGFRRAQIKLSDQTPVVGDPVATVAPVQGVDPAGQAVTIPPQTEGEVVSVAPGTMTAIFRNGMKNIRIPMRSWAGLRLSVLIPNSKKTAGRAPDVSRDARINGLQKRIASTTHQNESLTRQNRQLTAEKLVDTMISKGLLDPSKRGEELTTLVRMSDVDYRAAARLVASAPTYTRAETMKGDPHRSRRLAGAQRTVAGGYGMTTRPPSVRIASATPSLDAGNLFEN